jgi:hypothetical protein
MKKTILFLGFLMALLQPLAAQDTVHLHDMRMISRYYVPVWPDAFPIRIIDGQKYMRGWLMPLGENFHQIKDDAEYMYTDDTLQVYGIAASLTTEWRFFGSSIISGITDTSCEFVYDYLRLYEADPDSLRQIGEDLLVNLRYTPVSYYVDLGLIRSDFAPVYNQIIPMYERYFTTPVTVADSFYVGRCCRPDHHDGKEVYLIQLADSTYHGRAHSAWYLDYVWNWPLFDIYDSVIRGWRYDTVGPQQFIPFLFPIIAPLDTVGDTIVIPRDTIINPGDTIIVPGDTIINGGDTIIVPGDTIINGGDTIINPGDTIVVPGGDTTGVGIQGVNLLYRYTAVQPNPATDKVRVTSSFGLTRIEAYDLRGRLLFETPASGLKADLDVSSWPRGTYLLRISTPAGPTTKKLLVQ